MDNRDRIVMLQEENDRLREQVAAFERALGMDYLPPIEWRLTTSEARLFGALLARDLLTKDAAMAALYRDIGKDEADVKIIDVMICKMRKKLKPFGISIDTRWGDGWYLPAPTRALFSSQLEAAE